MGTRMTPMNADLRGFFHGRKHGFNQSGGFSPVIAEFGSINKKPASLTDFLLLVSYLPAGF
jgi:hypothetical protein